MRGNISDEELNNILGEDNMNTTQGCQWENCSGGEYCEKHSLLTKQSPANMIRNQMIDNAKLTAHPLFHPTETREWTKEFDEKFDPDFVKDVEELRLEYQDIKSFILSEKEKSYQEGYEASQRDMEEALTKD